MTDDFVKKAFADADKATSEKEFNAFCKNIADDDSQAAHLTAAMYVGLQKMDKMCEVAIKAGQGDTLAEYAHALLLVGFHIGYKAATEEVG